MRRGAVLIVGALTVALLAVASAGLAWNRVGPTSRDVWAIRSGARSEPGVAIVSRRRRRRPGCGAACRQLGIAEGFGGTTHCGTPPISNLASVASSTVLKIPASTDFGPIVPGDVLVAAIVTGGGGVTPPAGWAQTPNTDQFDGSNARLQVFYDIPVPENASARVVPALDYSFTSSAPQAMTGALTNFTGVSQTDPINTSGDEANPSASTSVTAPSIAPTASNTVLEFIAAADAMEAWTAPSGMMTTVESLQFSAPRTAIEVATQRWPAASATGVRTATISGASASVGDIIALNYPAPITCPHIRVLGRRATFKDSLGNRFRGPILRATANGLVSVRLRCDWTAPCVGAFAAFDGMLRKAVASDIALPAEQTRTVQIATTPLGQRELRRLHTVPLILVAAADLSNGQLVPASSLMGELELR